MYIQRLDHLLKHDDLGGVCFQPQVLIGNEHTSLLRKAKGLGFDSTPVFDTNDDAIQWLIDNGYDGLVQSWVRNLNGERSNWTAGVAARVYIDTSATDGDTETPTREELEANGLKLAGTYEGPFARSYAESIIDHLRGKHIGIPMLVKQGSGYNVVVIA